MEAALDMIVDLPDTTTNDLNKKITSLREEGGAITLGRVLTLVIAPDCEDLVEFSIDAAVSASREHPCRIIVVVPADPIADKQEHCSIIALPEFND